MHIECEDKTSKFVEHCGCTESEVDLRHHHIYNYDDFISPPEPTYISDLMSEPRNNLQTRHSMEQPQYLSSRFSDWSDSDHLSSTSLSSSSASGSFEIYVGNVTSVRFASTFAISVQRPYSMSDTMENYQVCPHLYSFGANVTVLSGERNELVGSPFSLSSRGETHPAHVHLYSFKLEQLK
jgi:hypothetical protein